jgi:hypothetical protein
MTDQSAMKFLFSYKQIGSSPLCAPELVQQSCQPHFTMRYLSIYLLKFIVKLNLIINSNISSGKLETEPRGYTVLFIFTTRALHRVLYTGKCNLYYSKLSRYRQAVLYIKRDQCHWMLTSCVRTLRENKLHHGLNTVQSVLLEIRGWSCFPCSLSYVPIMD